MEVVKIVFNHDWMGNPAGMKTTMDKKFAESLERRGTVKILIDKSKLVEKKSIDHPEQNKMISSPEKKKSGRPKKKK